MDGGYPRPQAIPAGGGKAPLPFGYPLVPRHKTARQPRISAPFQQPPDPRFAEVHIRDGKHPPALPLQSLDGLPHIGVGGTAPQLPPKFNLHPSFPGDAGFLLHGRPNLLEGDFRRAGFRFSLPPCPRLGLHPDPPEIGIVQLHPRQVKQISGIRKGAEKQGVEDIEGHRAIARPAPARIPRGGRREKEDSLPFA